MDPFFTSQTWIVFGLSLFMQLVQYPFLGKLVWPRWKLFGKIAFYLFVSMALYYYVSLWALLFIFGHPVLGIISFFFWCKKYGLDWKRVDAETYIRLQKETVDQLSNKED